MSGPKQDLLVKRKQTDVTLPAIMARSCRAHDARMRFVCLCIHTHTHTHTHIHTHRQHNMIWPGWFVCWQRLYVCMCVCVTRAHVYVCACVCLCTCLSACRTRRQVARQMCFRLSLIVNRTLYNIYNRTFSAPSLEWARLGLVGPC